MNQSEILTEKQDSHARSRKNRTESMNIPSDEEDLALTAIINSNEIKIEDRVSTVIVW